MTPSRTAGLEPPALHRKHDVQAQQRSKIFTAMAETHKPHRPHKTHRPHEAYVPLSDVQNVSKAFKLYCFGKIIITGFVKLR